MAKKTLAARVILFIVRLYRLTLSPFLGGACRFEPSCSRYALTAIERHGAWRGVALGVKRICRCHPFAAGGVDPVPSTWPRDARADKTKGK